jgi:GTP cyclohydrolase I
MDQKNVEKYFKKLMEKGLNLDLSKSDFKPTPARVAKMYCQELFKGQHKDFTDFALSKNKRNYNQIIVMDNIHFVSVCAHHFLPFVGRAWVLYLPKEYFVGASKPARCIEHYAARPQLQEDLCHDVINQFNKIVQPHGVMVVMRAIHGCMSCRGVRQNNGAGMMSSAVSGAFEKDGTKQEGLKLIEISIALSGKM